MIDPLTYHVIAQVIGILASAIIISGYIVQSDRKLKIIVTTGNIFLSLSFLLLGAYSGATVRIINCFRTILSIKYHNSNKVMLVFIFIYFLIALFLTNNLIDFLPFFTSIIGTIALYKLSGKNLRLALLFCSSIWLAYSVLFYSLGGVITELFVMSFNIISFFRIKRLN